MPDFDNAKETIPWDVTTNIPRKPFVIDDEISFTYLHNETVTGSIKHIDSNNQTIDVGDDDYDNNVKTYIMKHIHYPVTYLDEPTENSRDFNEGE
eukprot:UN34122